VIHIVRDVKRETEGWNVDGKVENPNDYKEHDVRNRMSQCPPLNVREVEFPPIDPLSSNAPLIRKTLDAKKPTINDQVFQRNFLSPGDDPEYSWYCNQISRDIVGIVNCSSGPSIDKFGTLSHREDKWRKERSSENWEVSFAEKDRTRIGQCQGWRRLW